MYTVECCECRFIASNITGWTPEPSAHTRAKAAALSPPFTAERYIAQERAMAIADRHEAETKHRGPFIWWRDAP